MLQLILDIKVPITRNDNISLRGQGLIIQNSGETTAILSNGYTLGPGATLNLGVSDDQNMIYVFDATVKFDGTGENVLEMIEIVADNEQSSNYKTTH